MAKSQCTVYNIHFFNVYAQINKAQCANCSALSRQWAQFFKTSLQSDYVLAPFLTDTNCACGRERD